MHDGHRGGTDVDQGLAELLALESELSDLTDAWTAPALVRVYPTTDDGDEDFQDDATVLDRHGYEASMQSLDGGHVHLGRLLLTGGLSILAGRAGIRSQAEVSVTFQRRDPTPSSVRSFSAVITQVDGMLGSHGSFGSSAVKRECA